MCCASPPEHSLLQERLGRRWHNCASIVGCLSLVFGMLASGQVLLPSSLVNQPLPAHCLFVADHTVIDIDRCLESHTLVLSWTKDRSLFHDANLLNTGSNRDPNSR